MKGPAFIKMVAVQRHRRRRWDHNESTDWNLKIQRDAE